jgi:hypothetical protein
MLAAPIWSCLSEDAQNHIRLFQQENYPDWDPPSDKMSKNVPWVTVHYDHAEDIPAIMQATPEQVKHGQGVFGEGKS